MSDSLGKSFKINMADEKPWFYTLRKHRKKSIAAAVFAGWLMTYGANKYREYIIRRELCHEAKAFGDTTLPSLKKPRRLTMFFNPAAGSGSADSLLKKNAEPILHIAGLDVTIVKTDYEGQIKTLTQYIDPKTDGIIVAGGDGSLLEVVTGLLRRSDQEEISKIPIGVIPLGSHNSFYNRLFGRKSVGEVRTIGTAALAIVEGFIKPVDVMEIKGDEGRSTFALSNLHWGAFRDANEKEDKYWIVGPLRRKLAYLVAAMKEWPPLVNTILTYPLNQSELKAQEDTMPIIQEGTKSRVLATACCESTMHSQQRHFDSEENEVRKNGWITSSVQTFGLRILPFRKLGSQTDCFLEVKLWPSDLTKTEFIETGWKMEKVEKQGKQNQDEDTRHQCLTVKQLRLEPTDDKVSWFSIDGEPFEAKTITISLLPQKLHFFFTPENIL
ncbi:acylglycerol kinase, mitochondrial-like isoform X1 [Acropora millepora]|uniref:acylglycerol kinase, mitochondrial-like isoform X1 n=1 Tax=Acropora millepora TaxID=45264 RepID=UPI001CF3D9D3|nr:acylglycerol kinase, mitochondrial-like isoform X1 [Acropora millepora]